MQEEIQEEMQEEKEEEMQDSGHVSIQLLAKTSLLMLIMLIVVHRF